MNGILLAATVGSLVALGLLRQRPYLAIIIMLADETASLAISIVAGRQFWVAVDGSLVGVLIVVLFYLGGRGRRRPAPKLIGDESRPARDRLLRTLRERDSPSPS